MRIVTPIIASIMLGLAAFGCVPPEGTEAAPEGDPGPSEASLLEADRAFAETTAERRIEGWMSYFAEDAARIEMGGAVIRGLENIREHDSAVHGDPSLNLLWEPTDAGLFDTGDHGFTRGRYELVKQERGTRSVISRGTYLTIWRHEAGRWKVILDTGVPDRPSEADDESD
jgi:ketosteroid isomerase-like protein